MDEREEPAQQMDAEQLKKWFRSIHLIHWGLFFAVIVHTALAVFFVQGMNDLPIIEQVNSVFVILTGLSVAQIIGVVLVRKFWLAPSALMEESSDIVTAIKNYRKAYIIQGGLSETMSIYGLLLSMLSGNYYYVAGFSLVAIALLLLFSPSQRDFKTRIEERGLR